jgi:MoxR-like ATPase
LSQKLGIEEQEVTEGTRKIAPRDVDNYLDLKELGKAFTLENYPAVVLIDEIDKADLDFPNDLLTVLEEPYEFTIRQTGTKIKAKRPPIVIITSNKEKGNLPAPFLRRCVYHFIEFPSKEQLEQIVDIHFQQASGDARISPPSKELKQTAIDQFLKIRQQKGLSKLPGTSEFLDWLRVLAGFREQSYPIESLESGTGPLPYRELLFKLRSDWRQAEFKASP